MQTDYVLYRNAETPIQGTHNGASFAFPGRALTASSLKLHIAEFPVGRKVKFARWVLVWSPMVVAGGGATAVRLVSFDDGPANIANVARIGSPTGQNVSSPIVSAVDITDDLNALILAGTTKQFGHQTAGTGNSGCLIYSSSLEVVWE
jgi:hypothetical protein